MQLASRAMRILSGGKSQHEAATEKIDPTDYRFEITLRNKSQLQDPSAVRF